MNSPQIFKPATSKRNLSDHDWWKKFTISKKKHDEFLERSSLNFSMLRQWDIEGDLPRCRAQAVPDTSSPESREPPITIPSPSESFKARSTEQTATGHDWRQVHHCWKWLATFVGFNTYVMLDIFKQWQRRKYNCNRFGRTKMRRKSLCECNVKL